MTAMTAIYIDPTAGYGGNGTLAKPYNSWYGFTLEPGDIALQRGGTTAGGFTVSVHGTASEPVIIGSYGAGQAQIDGTLVLNGASNVTVSGLDLTGGNAYDVMLENGTSSSVIQNCNINGGIGGIFVTGATSNSNAFSNNQIHDNDTVGVWFDGANASAGKETLVSGNNIYRNGEQGILLHGSHIVVSGNTVVNNGLSGLPGISAIHVIGTSSTDTSGQDNVISNNIVADQYDPSSLDGNGIMLDTWARSNDVIGNEIFGNSGAGISLFSASDNLVANNTLQGDVVDPGGTHVIEYSEIYLDNASYAPGQTMGNIITGNTVLAVTPYAAAIQASPTVTSDPTNLIYGNSLGHAGTGPIWISGTASGNSVAGWNAIPRSGADDALITMPEAPPSFVAPMLDRTFTLHSTALLTPNSNGISTLVANGTITQITGGPDGNWIAGDGQNNVLTGGGGNNLIAAGSGNTTIYGGSGSDILFGGAGNDVMFAGPGSTVMVGGAGNSIMHGGAGNDLLYAGNRSGTDILDGGAGTNTLFGGPGNDTFVLGSGVDFIYGFTIGKDLIDVQDLNIKSFAGLEIYNGPSNTLIADSTGTIHVALLGMNGQPLTASDFIFSHAS